VIQTPLRNPNLPLRQPIQLVHDLVNHSVGGFNAGHQQARSWMVGDMPARKQHWLQLSLERPVEDGGQERVEGGSGGGLVLLHRFDLGL